MRNQFLAPKVAPVAWVAGLEKVLLCDMDGTLSLLNGRNPYDASTCDQDELNEPVRFVLQSLLTGVATKP